MKLKTLSTAVICMGSLLALSTFAQQTPSTGTSPSMGSDTQQHSSQQHDLRASKAIGADVKTAQGEKLGKVNDLILSPSNGRVEFAVIDWNNKLVPVPFSLLNASSTGERSGFLSPTGAEISFTAKVDTTKLQNAPTIDKSRWTDIQQPGWSQKVYSYFGVSPEGMGAPGSGTEMTPGSSTTPDSGTTPDSSTPPGTPPITPPSTPPSTPGSGAPGTGAGTR